MHSKLGFIQSVRRTFFPVGYSVNMRRHIDMGMNKCHCVWGKKKIYALPAQG